ncbi:MAG: hypothetical protein KY476_24960, partial [Planctomycetes bacterium]|nr:hypothetical protein [Planctomycetota bacterium]
MPVLLRCLRPPLAVLAVLLAAAGGSAQDDQPRPLGRFLTVTSPIDSVQFGRVKNAALELQNRAVQENRRAVLVLEIGAGASDLYDVQRFADFLTSAEVSRVKTVAWIPETVRGENVIAALAANEIVMHPDAQLGDVGRGEALDQKHMQSVVDRVRGLYNAKLSEGLVQGL